MGPLSFVADVAAGSLTRDFFSSTLLAGSKRGIPVDCRRDALNSACAGLKG
jgi:hypothetical protein